jgi:hypothetical protein
MTSGKKASLKDITFVALLVAFVTAVVGKVADRIVDLSFDQIALSKKITDQKPPTGWFDIGSGYDAGFTEYTYRGRAFGTGGDSGCCGSDSSEPKLIPPKPKKKRSSSGAILDGYNGSGSIADGYTTSGAITDGNFGTTVHLGGDYDSTDHLGGSSDFTNSGVDLSIPTKT